MHGATEWKPVPQIEQRKRSALLLLLIYGDVQQRLVNLVRTTQLLFDSVLIFEVD